MASIEYAKVTQGETLIKYHLYITLITISGWTTIND